MQVINVDGNYVLIGKYSVCSWRGSNDTHMEGGGDRRIARGRRGRLAGGGAGI